MNRILVLIYISCLFILVSLFQSCEQTDPSSEAVLVTLNEIRINSGYGWFTPRYDAYSPNLEWIDSIKNNFDSTKDIFYVFSKPACSCEQSQEIFPQIMKILSAANIPESSCRIYTCKDEKSRIPYKNIILNSIPEIFIVKDTVALYSVVDSINLIKQTYADSIISTEKLIYYGLKK